MTCPIATSARGGEQWPGRNREARGQLLWHQDGIVLTSGDCITSSETTCAGLRTAEPTAPSCLSKLSSWNWKSTLLSDAPSWFHLLSNRWQIAKPAKLCKGCISNTFHSTVQLLTACINHSKKQMTRFACERHCHKIKFLIFYPLESIHWTNNSTSTKKEEMVCFEKRCSWKLEYAINILIKTPLYLLKIH